MCWRRVNTLKDNTLTPPKEPIGKQMSVENEEEKNTEDTCGGKKYIQIKVRHMRKLQMEEKMDFWIAEIENINIYTSND